MKKNFYNKTKENGITMITLVVMIILILILATISIFSTNVDYNIINVVDESTADTKNKVDIKVQNLIDNQSTLDSQDRLVTINLYSVDSSNTTSPLYVNDDVVLVFYLDKENSVKEFEATISKNNCSTEINVNSLTKGTYYVTGDVSNYNLIDNEINVSSYDYKINIDLFYRSNS